MTRNSLSPSSQYYYGLCCPSLGCHRETLSPTRRYYCKFSNHYCGFPLSPSPRRFLLDTSVSTVYTGPRWYSGSIMQLVKHSNLTLSVECQLHATFHPFLWSETTATATANCTLQCHTHTHNQQLQRRSSIELSLSIAYKTRARKRQGHPKVKPKM